MDDWRLSFVEESRMLNKRLLKKKFEADGYYDHVHCEFCWAKISEYTDTLHYGYYTEIQVGAALEMTREAWICEECYNDFKEMFHWTLESEKP